MRRRRHRTQDTTSCERHCPQAASATNTHETRADCLCLPPIETASLGSKRRRRVTSAALADACMDCYPAPIDTHNAAAGEAAPPRRMPSAPEAPPSSDSGLGLQRMRGYVTLSLGTPDQEEEPAAVSLSLSLSTPPPAAAAVQPRGGEKGMASEAYRAIAGMAARLGIAAAARDRAVEVFLRMEERKGKAHHYYTKGAGRSGDALYAACLYVACRRAGEPRTFKELATATRDGAAARKDIGKLIALIRKRLGDEAGGEAMMMDMGVVRAADYVERFGSLLGMREDEVRAVQEAARRMQDQLDVRRNPDSIAAAIIYMAMERRAGAGRSIRDVSAATGVAENTIKQAYRELCPHADMLFR